MIHGDGNELACVNGKSAKKSDQTWTTYGFGSLSHRLSGIRIMIRITGLRFVIF